MVISVGMLVFLGSCNISNLGNTSVDTGSTDPIHIQTGSTDQTPHPTQVQVQAIAPVIGKLPSDVTEGTLRWGDIALSGYTLSQS